MQILIGGKVKTMDREELLKVIDGYTSIIVDLGTGNGQFIYRSAKNNPQNMYIGIDSSASNMMEYSQRSNRSKTKGGLSNIIFVVNSVENIPGDLYGIADMVYVNLPWGTLRDGVVKGDDIIMGSIRKISKSNAFVEICVTYDNTYEKKEVDERKLPELSLDYIKNILRSRYMSHGFKIIQTSVWGNADLKRLDTKWAKKLAFGRKRDIYHIKCNAI